MVSYAVEGYTYIGGWRGAVDGCVRAHRFICRSAEQPELWRTVGSLKDCHLILRTDVNVGGLKVLRRIRFSARKLDFIREETSCSL